MQLDIFEHSDSVLESRVGSAAKAHSDQRSPKASSRCLVLGRAREPPQTPHSPREISPETCPAPGIAANVRLEPLQTRRLSA